MKRFLSTRAELLLTKRPRQLDVLVNVRILVPVHPDGIFLHVARFIAFSLGRRPGYVTLRLLTAALALRRAGLLLIRRRLRLGRVHFGDDVPLVAGGHRREHLEPVFPAEFRECVAHAVVVQRVLLGLDDDLADRVHRGLPALLVLGPRRRAVGRRVLLAGGGFPAGRLPAGSLHVFRVGVRAAGRGAVGPFPLLVRVIGRLLRDVVVHQVGHELVGRELHRRERDLGEPVRADDVVDVRPDAELARQRVLELADRPRPLLVRCR